MEAFLKEFESLATAYLHHLSTADLDGLLQLFAPDAEVLSPLYGRQPATDFYTQLFADTTQSTLTFKDCSVNPGQRSGCIFFNYGWQLANGTAVDFDVVDYLKLNEAGKITFLQIIYDTVQSRPAWESPQG